MFNFQELDEEEEDETSWATYKNAVYQNFNSDKRVALVSMWGDEVVVNVDSLTNRKWQITDSKRMIGKYQCRKAIWQMNDSTKIYAWYSIDILLPTGPEGFGGLPGTILGLATEDGGVVYFAKSVEVVEQKSSVFELKTKKKKVFTREELRTRLKDEMGDSPQGKLNISLMLDWL
jgi:GLPGLI family protein